MVSHKFSLRLFSSCRASLIIARRIHWTGGRDSQDVALPARGSPRGWPGWTTRGTPHELQERCPSWWLPAGCTLPCAAPRGDSRKRNGSRCGPQARNRARPRQFGMVSCKVWGEGAGGSVRGGPFCRASAPNRQPLCVLFPSCRRVQCGGHLTPKHWPLGMGLVCVRRRWPLSSPVLPPLCSSSCSASRARHRIRSARGHYGGS